MTQKMIIADDSLFARMLIKEAVSQIHDDIEYLEASSGEQVLALQAEDAGIDWFLLDVNMGEPNGLETAKSLIKRGVNVKKISLVTGNKSSELHDNADSINLNYINKAIGPADVEAFVHRLNVFMSEADGGKDE